MITEGLKFQMEGFLFAFIAHCGEHWFAIRRSCSKMECINPT